MAADDRGFFEMERTDGGRAAQLRSWGGLEPDWEGEVLRPRSARGSESGAWRRRARPGRSSLDLEVLRQLHADGAWQAVARMAGRWIRKEPSHLCVLEYLLEAEWRLGRLERVVTTATRLIAINPKEPCYHLLKGVALFSLNRPGAAMPSLQRALQLAQPGPLQTHIEHYTELTSAWQGVILAELIERNPALRAEFERAPEVTCLRFGLDFASVAATREQSCRNCELQCPAQLA